MNISKQLKPAEMILALPAKFKKVKLIANKVEAKYVIRLTI